MKSRFNNKIFWSFVISYIVVLMIPYGIGFFMYDNSVELLSEKIEEIETTAMVNRISLIDRSIIQFETGVRQIAHDNDVEAFINNYNIFNSGANYYAMTRSKGKIETLLSNNPVIASLTLISLKNHYVLTSESGTVLNINESFPYESVLGVEKVDFQQMIEKQDENYYFIKDTSSGKTHIYYVMPLVLADLSDPEGLIVAELGGIEDQLAAYSVLDGNGLMIINSYGESISNDTDLMNQVDWKGLEFNQGYPASKMLMNDKYLMTYFKSEISHWKFVSLIDVKQYLHEVNTYKENVLLFVIISAGIGVLIALYISRLKYKPIRKLKTLATKYQNGKGNGDIGNKDDDYMIIEDIIDNMVHTMDTYKSYIAKQERKNRNWYFSRIIRGWHIEEASQVESSELKDIKIRIKKGRNRVLVYQIDDFTNLFYESGMDIQDESVFELMTFTIINIFEEFFSAFGMLHVLSMENRFVIPLSINAEIGIDYVDKARVIKDYLTKNFGIIGSFALSSEHEGKFGIKLGYDNAVDVLELKNIVGDQNVILDYDQVMKEAGNQSLVFNIEKEKIFLNLVLVADFEAAKKSILEIIDEDVYELKSLQTLKVKLFGMIDKLMHGLMSLNERSEYRGHIDQKSLEKLLNAASIPELKKTIEDIFNRLIDFSEQEKEEHKEKSQDKIEAVITYISQHYEDPNLTVSQIAQAMEMGISNLSKFMKKEIGQSTLDYVHYLRVEKAKKYLLETNKNLEEIAEEVGYYNYRTLVSRFKKQEGITPTQFRENIH